MRKAAIVFLVLFAFFGLVACDSASDEIELSEYDKLSTLEKAVFDAFIMNVNDFYNPSEVRFLGFTEYYETSKSIYLNIQGTNKLGGTITKTYYLQVYDNTLSDGKNNYYYYKGDIYEFFDRSIDSDSEVKVGNLNRALIEYWEDLGL